MNLKLKLDECKQLLDNQLLDLKNKFASFQEQQKVDLEKKAKQFKEKEINFINAYNKQYNKIINDANKLLKK